MLFMTSDINRCENKVLDIIISDDKEKLKNSYDMIVRLKQFFVHFSLELFLFFYFIAGAIFLITTQQFNVRKACRADLNFSDTLCDKIANADISDNETRTALIKSEKLVAIMATWTSPIQFGVPVIMILFIGAWSDRTGNRKILMLLPITGEIISTLGLLLSTYNFSNWSILVTGLIECLPAAICGGPSVALMGSYSHIADVTSSESRTVRIGLLGIIVSFGAPIGLSLAGIITKKFGYYVVYSIVLVLYVFGAFLVTFTVKNVRQTKTEGRCRKQITEFFHPKNVWDTISILFRTQGRLFQIILIILIHVIIIGPLYGEFSVSYLYASHKFHMDVVEYGFFTSYWVLMSMAGMSVAVTVFCKILKLHDTLLGIIGSSCKVMSSLMCGLAPTKQWYYAGPALDFFGALAGVATRSLGTKLVNADDIGKFCSILGLVEGLAPVIYKPLYSKLYASTLEIMPGAFFILGGCMTVPAIFIFIYLYIGHKRSLRDIVKNPDNKEKYTHENAVTYL